MSGVIENAASAEARSIGSVNETLIVGDRPVPAPRGEPVTTEGRVTSTIVHVSFPTGAISTFPARSVEIVRYAYRWPSAPTYCALVRIVPMDPGTWAQGAPLSLASSVYDTMSVVPDTGPQNTLNCRVISYAGRTATAESGRLRSTFVHDWFPEGVGWTFPAQSVPIDRNSYVWASWAPVYVQEVVVTV